MKKRMMFGLFGLSLIAGIGCNLTGKAPEPVSKKPESVQPEMPKLNTPTARLQHEDITEENYANQVKVLESELARDRQVLSKYAKK